MTVAYEWNVVQMDCYPEVDSEIDVVFNVHWALNGSETVDATTYAGYCYGTIWVKINGDEPFTPYDQLTQEQVIGWVKSSMGVDQVNAYEANVAKQIADKQNPPIVTPPLPWSNS